MLRTQRRLLGGRLDALEAGTAGSLRLSILYRGSLLLKHLRLLPEVRIRLIPLTRDGSSVTGDTQGVVTDLASSAGHRRRVSRPKRQLVGLDESRERALLQRHFSIGETCRDHHLFASSLDSFP